MVSTVYDIEMKRSKEASCTRCKNLHTTCYSFIRAKILSQTEEVCDYARWGCQKYDGPGKIPIRKDKSTRLQVLEVLKSGQILSLDKLTETLAMDRQIVLNNISRLKRKGVPVKRELKEGAVYYQLTA